MCIRLHQARPLLPILIMVFMVKISGIAVERIIGLASSGHDLAWIEVVCPSKCEAVVLEIWGCPHWVGYQSLLQEIGRAHV